MKALRKICSIVNFPGWYKLAVGKSLSRWETIGKLQFDFLYDIGLQPENRLLDIGCGALRGGIHFIRYLHNGRYFGIDSDQKLLDVGVKLLHKNNLVYKRPILECVSDFRASNMFTGGFKYIIAISLFSHFNAEQIKKCLKEVNNYLCKDGCFYATFFEVGNKSNRIRTFSDKNPYHYSFEEMKQICQEAGLCVNYMGNGDWGHPDGQRMLVITKEKNDEKRNIQKQQ